MELTKILWWINSWNSLELSEINFYKRKKPLKRYRWSIFRKYLPFTTVRTVGKRCTLRTDAERTVRWFDRTARVVRAGGILMSFRNSRNWWLSIVSSLSYTVPYLRWFFVQCTCARVRFLTAENQLQQRGLKRTPAPAGRVRSSLRHISAPPPPPRHVHRPQNCTTTLCEFDPTQRLHKNFLPFCMLVWHVAMWHPLIILFNMLSVKTPSIHWVFFLDESIKILKTAF